MAICYDSISFDKNGTRELLKNYFDIHELEVVFQNNYGNGQVNSNYRPRPFNWDEDRKEILAQKKNLWDELAKL